MIVLPGKARQPEPAAASLDDLAEPTVEEPTSDPESIDPTIALAALERFVGENDELAALETRIGRFNIFDALGVVDVEIRHSNFLAWLLNPHESHNQGGLFLRAVLMDLLKQTPIALRPRGLSPITLDGGELRGLEIRREWRHIDLLIRCQDPPFVIAIENKIHAGEHGNQLTRYRETLSEAFPDTPAQFVFLTIEGDEPSDDDWTVYSYADLHDTLDRVVNANRTAIGDDVLAFLDHYLRILRSRLMEDPDIEQLCRTIYQNHRQAIDLIIENAVGNVGVIDEIAEIVRADERFRLGKVWSKRMAVQPRTWVDMLPPIGAKGESRWLRITIGVNAKKQRCVSQIHLGATTDSALRRAIAERLIESPDEFGLKPFFKSAKNLGTRWATLDTTRITSIKDLTALSDRERQAIRRHLDQRLDQLASVPDALRPIVEQWEQANT